MQVSTRETRGMYIIALTGRIVTEQDTAEFKDTVRDALINGRKLIIVDMSGVDWITSTGIAALIFAYTTMKEVDGQMRLAGVSNEVNNVLTINKLNLVFDMHDSVDAAVAASMA